MNAGDGRSDGSAAAPDGLMGGGPTAAPMVSPRFRIPTLDGLRALSVLAVFAAHASLPLPVGAGTGVTVFFFLSGFLITTLLRREFEHHGRISLRNFYLRRALRILPPMYVVVIAAFILTASGAILGSLTSVGMAAALLNFTNFVYVFGDPNSITPGIGLLWSLAVEEHFYLLFPLLYMGMFSWLPRRSHGPVLFVLCLVTVAWRCVLVFALARNDALIYFGSDTRADSLLYGCLLAVAANPILDRVKMRAATAVIAVVVGAALIVGAEHLPGHWDTIVGPTAQGIGLLLAVSALVARPRMVLARLLEWRPLVWLGVLSYAFYLVHRLVQLVVAGHTTLGTVPAAAVSLGLALVLSQLIHTVIEIPSTRLRHRWPKSRPAPAGAPVAHSA